MAHCVFRSDLLLGTTAGEELVSAMYVVPTEVEEETVDVPTELDNGSVVLLTGLMTGEREIYRAVDCAANSNIDDVVVLAAPEVLYDERQKNLDEFFNVAGKPVRGYRLHRGNIFSLTAEGLSAAVAIAVGDIVELQAGHKLKVVKTATAGSTIVGKICHIEQTKRYKYFGILIQPGVGASTTD